MNPPEKVSHLLSLKEQETSVVSISEQYDVPRSTFYHWLSRYDTHHTYENRSTAPHKTHGKITEEVKAAVLEKHRKNPRLGESRMKTVAYLRVSKDTQDVNNQRLAILQFAQRERIQVDGFMEVTVSSRKSVKERKIDILLDQLFEGDTLIVSELSRIGRSVGEIITIVDTLVKKRISFFAVKEGIRLYGSQDCEDIQTKVMITLFGLFAEIERKLISMRTREALAAAKAAGKKLGRPKGILGKSRLDNQREEIIRLLALSVPKTIIARITGVDRSTIYHFIKSRGLS